MEFPEWLTIRNVIPLNYLPLSSDQKKILNDNIPLPKGKGKTARIIARENLKERIAPLLEDVTLLRNQMPFQGLKQAINNRDLEKMTCRGSKRRYRRLKKKLILECLMIFIKNLLIHFINQQFNLVLILAR